MDWITLQKDADTGIETVQAHFGGHAYDPHSHDELLIGTTQSGVQQFNCKNIRHASTAGDVIFLEPGSTHDGFAPEGHDFTYIMLSIPTSFLNAFHFSDREFKFSDLGNNIKNTVTKNIVISKFIEKTFLSLRNIDDKLRRDENIDRFIQKISENISSHSSSSEKIIGIFSSRARDYIHENLSEDVTLDELASFSGTDRFRLTREFSRHFGMAPHAYRIRLRLRAAKRLLAQGEKPAQIAASLGFADQSHLGRWFKRAYRLSPAQYQRACTDILYVPPHQSDFEESQA